MGDARTAGQAGLKGRQLSHERPPHRYKRWGWPGLAREVHLAPAGQTHMGQPIAPH
jgi:hypothetical protein